MCQYGWELLFYFVTGDSGNLLCALHTGLGCTENPSLPLERASTVSKDWTEFIRQHYMRYRLIRHVSNLVALGGDYLREKQTRNKKKAKMDNTNMYCPAEDFRKFYYRSCIVQLKEDRAVCNPDLSAVHSSGQSTNKCHYWNLKERANKYTVTPVLPPNNRLSLAPARLRESINLQVRYVINRDHRLGRLITLTLLLVQKQNFRRKP